MLFVPVAPPRPSPRAEELAKRLGEAIDAYSVLHPDLSPLEIQQAAQLAATKRGQPNPVIAAAVVAAILAVGVLFAVASKNQAGLDEQFVIPGIIVIVGVVLVGLMFYLKSR